MQGFIVKSLDQSQSGGPGDPNDVLPFLIPFQDLRGEMPKHPPNSPMFVDLPHTVIILYYIQYDKLPILAA
jgi:hypothetical protein